ncbi:transcriptional regulator GlcR [Pseudoduganella ginsengisoli]|uniref:DeoR family transcriptional regulator n=1 Tax=Pseudoduganella ginsengisoli TaxID=1462440 RepID=A0A6L6Q7E2_9BURK|nr:DeoR/GlpR family DNA-binding transcription regulator [Pseudoduganella ginsengisoli]MTW05201.1 DeoR family transcriptional regulator [Pseudoduganella ginsengisoli]
MSGDETLSQSARLDAICAYLGQHYRIGIEEICTLFGVTRDTARRDVVRLDADGRVLRVRGGAVLPPQGRQIEQYAARTGASAAKRAIGQAAGALLRGGDRVLFDTSTTVLEAARAATAKPLNVVTNSIDVAEALGQRDGVELHVLGGRFNAWQRSLEGAQARAAIAQFQFDKLVLGACAIDPLGLTCPSDDEAALKQAMMRQASQVIVVADVSKFSKAFLHRLCTFDAIDVLVADQPPPAAIAAALAEAGVQVIVASGD